MMLKGPEEILDHVKALVDGCKTEDILDAMIWLLAYAINYAIKEDNQEVVISGVTSHLRLCLATIQAGRSIKSTKLNAF